MSQTPSPPHTVIDVQDDETQPETYASRINNAAPPQPDPLGTPQPGTHWDTWYTWYTLVQLNLGQLNLQVHTGTAQPGTPQPDPPQPDPPQPDPSEPSGKQRVSMYKAAVTGNWKAAEQLILENSRITNAAIVRGGYTALHVATGARQLDFVKMLMAKSTDTESDLSQTDENDNNAFCIAASAGSVEIAIHLLSLDSRPPSHLILRPQLTIRGSRDKLPLYFAAWFGHEEMAKFLYSAKHPTPYSEADLIDVFFISIESGLYGVASTLLEHHKKFASIRYDGKTALHLLAQKPSAFTVGTPSGSAALKLLEDVLSILVESGSIFTSDFRKLIRRPSHVLFDAVKSGNSELVVKLIDVCPSLIWEINDRNWSIIHAAVSHRDATIFNLVHDIGFFKDVIVDSKDDKNGDTLLHLAARLAPSSQLDKLPGAAFQMKGELIWFEKVKNTVQVALTEVKNGANQEGKTAQELFTDEHKLLLEKGREWMQRTASSCTVVSTLIASTLFAAGITVTVGGNTETSNHHFRKAVYRTFIISDAVAFLLSLAAILTFLNILSSRYAERDFLKSLPLKLKIGLGFQFISIITMMVTFSTASFIAYSSGKDFLPFLVIGFAGLLGLLYLYMQLSIFKEIFE